MTDRKGHRCRPGTTGTADDAPDAGKAMVALALRSTRPLRRVM
ncbi:MAG: hypothetical protein QOI08_2018 [Actinomycetota bacterium]|nr:hypothetical protein [Actinomycetota bacterium]